MDDVSGDLAVQVVSRPGRDPDSVREVLDLVELASSSLGRGALSEHKRMELGHAGNAPDDLPTGHAPPLMVLARAATGGTLLGYAHVSIGPEAGWYAAELVIDPTAASSAGDGGAVADALLDAASSVVAERGGGSLRLWVASAGTTDDVRAGRHGFEPERDLIQMRCPLPLVDPPADSSKRVTLDTRAFRPGLDEQAWLATNNRAFAAHPEQGHWSLATLEEREREPWFDPEGLLLFESEGRLAGSCWTKVHRDADPPMGEIYVIGVDPDFHGRGWGRALTQAGLDWLAAQGLTVGMLYVDSGNRSALSMYRSMGFQTHHIDRAYLKHIDPAGGD